MGNAIFQVNLSGVLKVLSDSLYSSWEVFIRELLQNANDAIVARRQHEDFSPYIHIDFFDSKEGKILVLKDNGIGLTAEEMVEFLSKIGSSSKRDASDLFNREQATFIGQFGIGLLSCFMVSDTIEVLSTALKSPKTMKWVGKADGTYAIEESAYNQSIGTTVRLEIKADIALDHDKLVALLHRYGDYLPVSISYAYNTQEETLFNKEFPWLKESFSNEALLLGNKTFNEKFSHYFPIQDEEGGTRGIAYIMPRATHTASQSKHVLYIKKMFISADCADILPSWAFFVKAIVNSDNLATTASREAIYHNDTLDQVRTELGKSIINHLVQLSKDDPESLKEIILTHGQALKALALEDDTFFQFIADWFLYPTTEGYMSFIEIKNSTDKILFVSDIDEFRQIAPVARANQQLVINAGYIYDTPILKK
ncbi:MAG TPA: HSP90 family protein, partial [Cytophagales bacterium]|nr:HSP90 family protein [Cytophagales bacterium]